MDAIRLDQLPDLCLRKIFVLLGLRDLVKCRVVSRQFKYYADRREVTELVLTETRRCPSQSRTWFQTDKQVDYANSFSLNAFKSAKPSPFELDQLKFVHIRDNGSSNALYKALKGLKQLIHLEIVSEHLSGTRRTLILPDLKVLVIENQPCVVLMTPKLEVLRCDDVSRVQFKYPETIKWLECSKGYRDLAKLSNLEAFHVLLGTYSVLDVHLSDLPGLKELHFIIVDLRDLDEEDYEEFRSKLPRIHHQRSALQRDGLKLYLNDVLLDDSNLIRALDVLLDPSIADEEEEDLEDRVNEAESSFKFMNYRQLLRDSYPKVNSVNFSQLMRLDFEISEDFFDRFPRIQELTATSIVDREKFEWFLRNATALRVLKLTETYLNQTFFDHLPKLSSRLTRLVVGESLGFVINFKFLLQFEQLEEFETNQPLHSFLLAAAAFRQLAKLKSLQFRTGDSLAKIQRSSALKDDYSLLFFDIDDDDIEATDVIETFYRKNLSWTQLAALYDSETTVLLDVSENRMRIKRARLE